MRFSSVARALLVLAGLLIGQRTCIAESAPATGDEIVALPAYVVKEDRELPKWRYIAHRDFELLALAPDRTATKLAEELAQCIEMLDAIIPPEARLRLNPPASFIFDTENVTTVNGKGVAALAPDRVIAINNAPRLILGGLDRDTYSLYVSGEADSRRLNPYANALVRIYLYPTLLTKSYPRPLGWLAAGISRVPTRNMSVKDRTLSVSYSWPGYMVGSNRVTFLSPAVSTLNRPEISQDFDAAENRSLEVKRFRDTAALFARWALFAEEGKYRARFWEFYQRSARAPDETQPLFPDYFGMEYYAAARRVSLFGDDLIEKSIQVALPKSQQTNSPSKIRAATPAEIARITGEWARVAASTYPRQRELLVAAAGRIFDRGLRDSPKREPALLASAGIYRAEMGRDTDALPLLAEATKAGVVRPRAYLELARIRFTAAKARPEADGKLSTAQFASVMEPLQQSFAQSDQQENYYELLVNLWENAPEKPTSAELASLSACAKIFTHRTDLTLRSAQLHAALGYATEARALCETALPFAKDEAVRSALMALSKSLTTTKE